VAERFNFKELSNKEAAQSFTRQGNHEVDGGWRYLHGNMPLKSGAKITKESLHTVPVPNIPPVGPSPFPLQGFLGHIDPIDLIPPDCDGSVGINEVVTATNEYVIVHAKNGGSVLSQVTFSSFFNTPNMSDPYMQFDPYLNRYWITGISTTTPNKVFMAVTETADPQGNWIRYSFTPTSTDGSLLLDHPYIGLDNKLVVIDGRKFPNGGNYTGPILFIFSKDSLAAGRPIIFGSNAQTIEKTAADGDVACPVSAFGLSSPASAFYIVQEWNGSASAIRLSTITGTLPNLTWNTGTAVYPSGGTPWSDAQLGNLAPQQDETRLLAVNDARISSAQMVNGNIWCAHHIGLPATNFTHTAIQWWELSTTGAILQRGRIDDPTGATSRYYPTIAVNPADNVLIGYTISSPTTRVNAAYSTRTTSTPPDTTNDEYVFKGGTSTYWKDYGSGRARWGDYSHTVVDPVSGDLWTIQQYADQRLSSADNDSRYGVWWAEVSFFSFNTDVTLSAIVDPNNQLPYCNGSINPKVTIKNVGLDTIKSVKVGLILDSIPIGSVSVTGLNLGTYEAQDVSITLPINPPPGNHVLQAYTFNPNATIDQRTANDTSAVAFLILPQLPLPDFEGFDNAAFPPAGGWAIDNPDLSTTWQRTTTAYKSGGASMFIDDYSYSAPGAVDILQSPKIDISHVDSLYISFDVAYAQYSAAYSDSLQVVYSTDCGVTWQPTAYSKGGASLATNGGAYVTTEFVPNSTQWRHETINLSTCSINAASILIGLKSVNENGNDIYVDNLSVSALVTSQENAAVLSISQPPQSLCTTGFTPAITIANFGSDTLKTVTINYQVDNGTVNTFNFTGSLPKCTSQNVTLNPVSSSAGQHVLTIYTSNPNGIPDQYSLNDTMRKSIIISPVLPAPVAEGFESTTFPPPNWGVGNPDGLTTWARTTASAKTGVASMYINNFSYGAANNVNKFFSPVVQFDPTVDSFFVSFDYAYSPGAVFPGSTNMSMDTFEIQLTQDCGVTFNSIWKKWGVDLQTIGDLYNPVTTAFVPTTPEQWRHTNIFLSPLIGSQNFQLYFIDKGNNQNNLYVDNIDIYTKTVPANLKLNGFVLYPSPFRNTFTIRNYAVPTNLKSVAIFNSVGQRVWMQNYNGTAYTEMPVDLSNQAAGVYIVKMQYTDKTIIQRIVKQ